MKKLYLFVLICLIPIVARAQCSSTVSSVVASTTTACAATPIELSDSGIIDTGATYQWQSSHDTIAWTDISGATAANYTFSGLTANTYYRCVVTCSGGTTIPSYALLIAFSPCYCTPDYYYAYDSSLSMTHFLLHGYSGTSIDDALPASGEYADRTSSVATIQLQQAGTYYGTVTYGSSSFGYQNQVWIDFGDDGTFGAADAVTAVFGTGDSYSSSSAFTLSVPLAAAIGNHRMRVRQAADYSGTLSGNMSPCNSYDGSNYYYYGLAADYTTEIIAVPVCTGTPTPGTVSVNHTYGCSTTSITATDSGETLLGGISFQWQLSPDSATWSNISGATSQACTFSGLASTSYLRCVVTCDSSSISSFTDAKTLYYGPCYCTPSSYSGFATDTSRHLKYFSLSADSATIFSDNLSGITSGYAERMDSTIPLTMGTGYSGHIVDKGSSSHIENCIWIDFNDDGTFAAAESVTPVFGSIDSASEYYFTLTLPITGTVGHHRMRLRHVSIDSSTELSTSMDPCNYYDAADYYFMGEDVEYAVEISPAPSCSGTPEAGTATTSSAAACTITSITLSDVGSYGSGTTFQWQSSGDSLTWTNISGATNVNYTFSGLTATTYYRCIATCSYSSLSATSSITSVSYHTCYCTPSYIDGSYYYYQMSAFSLSGYGGTSISDTLPPGSEYTDRTSVTSPVDLRRGDTYSGSVAYYSACPSTENEIWIDFNDDATFSSSEGVTGVFGTPGTATSSAAFSLSIPSDAPLGMHRMRVRQALTYDTLVSAEMDPCLSSDALNYYYYGLTADYTANVLPEIPCSGAPSAGVANINVPFACASTTIILSDSSYTISDAVFFQWQSSNDSSTWANISGATSAIYNFAGLTENTYFRVIVTCDESGMSDTAYAGHVYSGPCYCMPSGYGTSFLMNYFSLSGSSGAVISDDLSGATSSYVERSGIYPILAGGSSYTGYVRYGTFTNHVENQIWIDMNSNGTFSASEAVTPVFGSLTSAVDSSAFTMTVPGVESSGYYRMRVRNVSIDSATTLSTSMDPCASYDAINTYSRSLVVDYEVYITAPLACTGAPDSGTVVATEPTACSVTYETLTNLGTFGAGTTFQWQLSADDATWTDIAGATNLTYVFTGLSASTYYRCVATCSASGLHTSSSSIEILYHSCYCTPSYTDSVDGSHMMNTFSLSGYSGSSISDAFSDTAVFIDRSAATAAVDLRRGDAYSGTIGYTSASTGYEDEIWIDFNDNTTYESSENVSGVFGAPSSSISSTTFTLTVPATAALGTHHMRVRQAYIAGTSLSSAMDPCSSFDAVNTYIYGLTVDYMVNVLAVYPCTDAPDPGVAGVWPGYGCSSTSFTLADSGYTISDAITLQWQSSADSSSWTNIPGATGEVYTFSGLTATTTYFRCVVTCGSSGLSGIAYAGAAHWLPCYCIPSSLDGFSSASGFAMSYFSISADSTSFFTDDLSGITSGYTERLGTTIPLNAGFTYTGYIKDVAYETGVENQLWIDFNDNGTFSASESITDVFGSTSYMDEYNFTITLPVTASGGTHVMRLRHVSLGGASSLSSEMDPCNYYDATDYYYFGETVDYIANVTAAPTCTGTPSAGFATFTALAGTICSTHYYQLSDSGYSVASGLAFQWQYSTDSVIWNNISDAGSANYTFTGIGPSEFFRCIVTCTSTGASAASTAVHATINRISGYITFAGAIPDTLDMRVWLVKYDSTTGIIAAADSVYNCVYGSESYYEFNNEPAGNYLVKAKLIYGDAPGSSGYIATYATSSLYWDSAYTVPHIHGADSGVDIHMRYGTVPPGPGFIGGSVSTGSGKGTSGFVPAVNVLVYLRNASNSVLTYTYTDSAGDFSFSHIGVGTYNVYPEELGYTTYAYPGIAITTDHPTATDIDFYKNASIHIITPVIVVSGVHTANGEAKINMYPNPAASSIAVTWSNAGLGVAHLALTDELGRCALKTDFDINSASGNKAISLDNLPDGVYFLNLSGVGIAYTAKLVIQH